MAYANTASVSVERSRAEIERTLQRYFEAFGQVSLYVVKSELRGAAVYVPEDAIHLVHAS